MAVRPVTPVSVPVASSRSDSPSRMVSSSSVAPASAGPNSGRTWISAPVAGVVTEPSSARSALVATICALTTPSRSEAQAVTSPKAAWRCSSSTSRASTTTSSGASRPGPKPSEISSEAWRWVLSLGAVESVGKASCRPVSGTARAPRPMTTMATRAAG